MACKVAPGQDSSAWSLEECIELERGQMGEVGVGRGENGGALKRSWPDNHSIMRLHLSSATVLAFGIIFQACFRTPCFRV